ncbi:putative isoleucyl-tRNA synthetase [Rhypophila decipiens]
MSSWAPTIGPSIAASLPSWGARSDNGESPPSSASVDVSPTSTAFSIGNRSPPPSRIEGWPLLAELMAQNPAFEGFARFRSLNVKNLLYYQVELTKLEDDLRDREIEDMDPGNDDFQGEQKWSEIHENPEIMISNKKLPHQQWAKVQEIRKLLREYNEALLQYAQVSALGEPSTHNMRELVTWVHDKNLGNLKVNGYAAEKWGPYKPRERKVTVRRFLELFLKFIKPTPKSPLVSDLIAPRAGKPPDRLGRWISEEALPFRWDFGEYWSKKHKTGTDEERNDNMQENEKQTEEDNAKPIDERITKKHIQTCQEITILSITAAVCTLVACMLPIAAIFLLAIVNELWHRLYMIASFSLLFASLLMLLTEATRVQVFTATSAFLAVLVVFIPAGGG